jgi:hypothetical protein
LTKVKHTGAHDVALTLLSGAPGDDPRVQALVHERTAALESERLAARAAEAAAARERDRIADEQQQRRAMDVVARAQQLFEAGQHAEASTLLRQAPPHALIQAAQTQLAVRIAEADRLRQRAERIRTREQRSAVAATAARRIIGNGRVSIGAAVIVVAALSWGGWQLLPASRSDEQTKLAIRTSPADPGAGPASPQPVDTPSIAPPGGETPPAVAPPDVTRPAPQPPRPRDSAAAPDVERPPVSNPQRPPVPGPATGPATEPPVAGPIVPAIPAPPAAPPQQQPAPSAPERAGNPPPEDRSPAPPASVNLEDDRAEIQALLTDYVAAYSRLDDGRLKSIDPGFDGIRQRALIRSVELRLQASSIRVAADGQTAVLNATGTFNYVWNRERMPPTTPAQLTWNLRKVNGRWVVAR